MKLSDGRQNTNQLLSACKYSLSVCVTSVALRARTIVHKQTQLSTTINQLQVPFKMMGLNQNVSVLLLYMLIKASRDTSLQPSVPADTALYASVTLQLTWLLYCFVCGACACLCSPAASSASCWQPHTSHNQRAPTPTTPKQSKGTPRHLLWCVGVPHVALSMKHVTLEAQSTLS